MAVEELEKLFEGKEWKSYDSVCHNIAFPENQILPFKKMLFERNIFLQSFFTYVVEAGNNGDQRVLELIEEARKKKYKEIATSDDLKKSLSKHEQKLKEKTSADLLYEIINQRKQLRGEQEGT